MKKWIALFLALTLVLSLAACGAKAEPTEAPTEVPTEAAAVISPLSVGSTGVGRAPKAPLCKGSCREATEGLCGELFRFRRK